MGLQSPSTPKSNSEARRLRRGLAQITSRREQRSLFPLSFCALASATELPIQAEDQAER
jgi:hypothetical protein